MIFLKGSEAVVAIIMATIIGFCCGFFAGRMTAEEDLPFIGADEARTREQGIDHHN